MRSYPRQLDPDGGMITLSNQGQILSSSQVGFHSSISRGVNYSKLTGPHSTPPSSFMAPIPSAVPQVGLTGNGNLRISRAWAMPSKWTFTIKPIKELLERIMGPNFLEQRWLDPMAGLHSPCNQQFQNDINPMSPAGFHLPAETFLMGFRDQSIDGILFDPPYSIHQVKVAYDQFGLNLRDNITGGFPKAKDQIARILKPGGYCISFGWNTTGMGTKRGFEKEEIMMVAHGGNRNDTLVTVERKL